MSFKFIKGEFEFDRLDLGRPGHLIESTMSFQNQFDRPEHLIWAFSITKDRYGFIQNHEMGHDLNLEKPIFSHLIWTPIKSAITVPKVLLGFGPTLEWVQTVLVHEGEDLNHISRWSFSKIQ